MPELCDTAVSDRKMAAGLLAIFLGGLGLHKLLLGRIRAGLIMLLASVAGGAVSAGVLSVVVSVVGILEGLIYLTRTPEEFRATCLAGRREWF